MRFADVFWLLLGMGLLRHVMNKWNIPQFLSQWLMRRREGAFTLRIAILSAFLAWPLSLGAVPLVIDALKQGVTPKMHLAAIAMRMTSITMVLMPTTLGAAAVFTAMPGTPVLLSALLGIPLFLFSLSLQRISPVMPRRNDGAGGSEPVTALSKRKIWKFLVIFWLTFLVAMTVIKLNVLQSIAMTACVLYTVERVSSRGIDVLPPLTTVARGMSGEVLLLVGCSLLVTTCALLMPLLPIVLTHSPGGFPVWLRYACILFVLPILSVSGIHPMALFSLMFPLLAPSVASDVTDYLAWICFFIAAQLLSPVSISAIFAAGSLQVSPSDTSFRMHTRYVLIFNFFSLIYLNVVANIL